MSMVTRETATVTEHGILVPLGRFAQQVGVDDAFRRVPFEMKTVVHSPDEKLTELLCHICGGGMHLTDLENSAHPLVEDPAVVVDEVAVMQTTPTLIPAATRHAPGGRNLPACARNLFSATWQSLQCAGSSSERS